MSDEKKTKEPTKEGKHAKPADPEWPGANDPGKQLDEWLEKSNKEAEGK